MNGCLCSKPLRLALTALSRPDLHIQKTYKIVRSVTRVTHWPRLNPLYKPWDHKISRAGHTVPVRIFTPDHTETPARLFLFFHGGGWVTGDIDSYSDVCVRLSNAMGAKVASVDYGLAPEHRYCLLAFSHCCAGILRGLGRPVVPMAIMLAVWCALRICYITVMVRLIPDIGVIFWAYPLTWAVSGVLFAWYLAHAALPSPGGGAPQQKLSGRMH